MRKKKLHLLLTILILVVFCTIALLSMGCKESRAEIEAAEGWEKQQKRIEENEAIAAEEVAPAEEVANKTPEISDGEAAAKAADDAAVVAEEEEKLISNEPITYSGNIDGVPVIIMVDFKTKEVTGPINFKWRW